MRSKVAKSKLMSRLEALQSVAAELIRSQNAYDLLSLIVNKAVDLLVCDAGSLYLAHNESTLAFEVAVNRTIAINFERRLISTSGTGIAAYCFRSGKTLRIRDVRKIPDSLSYNFDRSFDLKTGYLTRSILVCPLRSSKGKMLGVIQLINRKHRSNEAWPSKDIRKINRMPIFSQEDENFVSAFAALASAALENTQLYNNIAHLFEGFVKAAVDAIETRDLATRGHSERVAILTLSLAELVSQSMSPEFRHLHYNEHQLSELRYAALLHDFGKLGVREEVLLKAEKFFPHQKKQIFHRLQSLNYRMEIYELRKLLTELLKNKRLLCDADFTTLDHHVQAFKCEIENHKHLILEINKPSVLSEDNSRKLDQLREIQFPLLTEDGVIPKLLEPEEVTLLRIKRGSLSDLERSEIEQHVTNTYHFLRKIPWTEELSEIPEIAYAHHEMLNGTGYPRKLTSESIPIRSKMMAICDIFDALVAADRPYKLAIPFSKALDILNDQSKNGQLDASLLKLFIDSKVFENPNFLAKIGNSEEKLAA